MSEDAPEDFRDYRSRLGGGKMTEFEHREVEKADVALLMTLSKLRTPHELTLQSLTEVLLCELMGQAQTDKELIENLETFYEEFLLPQALRAAGFLVRRNKENKEKLAQMRAQGPETANMSRDFGSLMDKTRKSKEFASLFEAIRKMSQVDENGTEEGPRVVAIDAATPEEAMAKVKELIMQSLDNGEVCNCPICTAEREARAKGVIPNPETKH